jgi:CHAT domain-containing protein
VNGILTAEELSSLDLSNCELAVLSACETNVGIRRAGQGIQSLQAALHAAGARTAVTSLWRVDDAATRKLMERFYTYLWIEKLPKAEALWRAKTTLREEGHPVRDWAGWVLSGDPE